MGPYPSILSLIPQQQPFVMVDELLYTDAQASRTSFTIQADNVMVSEGFFTEGGLLENMAQTAAAGAGYAALSQNKQVEAGYIGAVKNLVIHRLPAVGDILETEVFFKEQVFNVTLVTASVTCNGEVIANCEMKIFIDSPA